MTASAAAKVMLDAGHGGSDPGAVGTNGLYEKTVNMDVVLRLKDELARRGYEVLLTREQDINLTLAQRVEITGQLGSDLFVSVHANSHTDSSARGSLVLYYDRDYPQANYPPSDAMAALTPESKRLAQLVQNSMVAKAGTADKGIVPSAVYVARMGSVPSILIETAFLSNSQDAALLADAGFRQKLAIGIADGISVYMPAEKPAGAFTDVSASHWAASAINKLQTMGIVQGEYGKFFPERALTRAEFIAMLERQFPFPSPVTGVEAGCAAGTGNASTVTGATYGSNGTGCADSGAATGDSGTGGSAGGKADAGTQAGGITVGSATGSSTAGSQAGLWKPKDLPASHWAYASINKALESGVLGGYPDGTVRPDQTLTRGEAAALIDRIIWPGSSQTATKTLFKDVPKNLWSAAAINRLKDKGIIDGETATTFAPERPITRAEMCAILARLIH
jgi:N-acetylmuramoyl-L-alanine amidase